MTALLRLPPQEAYARIAANYDAAPNPLIALEQRTLAPQLGEVQGLVVADIAAGTGRWGHWCRERGGHVVSIDFCEAMLRQAQGRKVVAEANRIPLRDAAVDVTICAFGIGYAPTCLAELARITRPGGSVFVSDVHPDALRRGWTRTFRADGEVIEVSHAAYELSELRASGLALVRIIEPRFGETEREIFAAAGKLAEFEAAARHPAIFVAQWKRIL